MGRCRPASVAKVASLGAYFRASQDPIGDGSWARKGVSNMGKRLWVVVVGAFVMTYDIR